jgi:hypothetical protein
MKRLQRALALALGAAVLAGAALAPAQAGLGQTLSSVQADRVSMKGQLRGGSKAGPGFTVQQITAASGTLVREYVSPSGVVFAVSWDGPAMPNLQQLLGTYFTQFQSAVKRQRASGARPGHDHLQVRGPSLVVHTGGHMRQLFGMAYVPSLVPANVSVSDLH